MLTINNFLFGQQFKYPHNDRIFQYLGDNTLIITGTNNILHIIESFDNDGFTVQNQFIDNAIVQCWFKDFLMLSNC